jgi:CheY-like chemotaxis protein/two-component sensor histidine kinase
VEFAKTIHSSGNDLLTLINDILDLSKIESGTVVVDVSELRFDDLHHYCERAFSHVAESKNLDFLIQLDPHLPKSMITDAKRLQQILKNLLSNAFKFTTRGQVALSIELTDAQTVAFNVSDTGIGIPADKQQIVFEAFQQADGSTSRKYGGTGLGLAISRELSRLLGGEIQLTSSPRMGSTFTLYLPLTYSPTLSSRRPVATERQETEPSQAESMNEPAPASEQPLGVELALAQAAEHALLVNEAGDDRGDIKPGDRVVLIVENDLPFARVLLETVRENGCKGLVTSQGAAALALARDFTADLITLDLKLPDMDGWRVIARLKGDLSTRHIPVCVISTEESRERAFDAGALGFIPKPIQSKDVLDAGLRSMLEAMQRRAKRVLVGARNSAAAEEVFGLIACDWVELTTAADPGAFMAELQAHEFDCAIIETQLGIDLSDVDRACERNPVHGRLPVILLGPPTDNEPAMLAHYDSITLKRVHSWERLIDWTALFLHHRVTHLPGPQHRIIDDLHRSDSVLAGKKALIVDDDIRNVFALATVLEDHGMSIVSANSGVDALDIMKDQRLDIVLMDIMMPEMDGIATMREARKLSSCRDLPIIAVTAKAMKGDRERCIEAGAWDYLSKPVDSQQLLAVLRSWLYR